MSNRSVKFVPALFAGVVAGANLATMTDLRAQVISAAEAATPATQAAADSCLSAPKGATPVGQPLVLSHRPRHQTSMLVSPGGERHGRRQVRTRRAASFGARRSAAAEPRRRRSNERSHASRSPTRVPNGSPSNPAPSQIRPPEPSRERLRQLPPRPLKMPSAQPCRTCSRRRRCRRCDGTTLPPQDLWPIQPISRSPPPTRPQPSRHRPRKCSSPRQQIRLRPPQRTRRRQSRPHRCRSCFW